MENNTVEKESNIRRVAIGFLYNMILLIVFTTLMLIIREWYIMPMLLLWDRTYLLKERKK
ncbi:MAG TPA: hypothetical protein VJ647_00570 [Chitinophagaceae bacterium]|nr:hypothetical protein [Chitinophagaceae bacterium]